MFITFEGGEGCGKSMHSKLLKRYLQKEGYKVILTQEPGATELGKLLRRILLKDRRIVSKCTELFLFAADRAEHIERVIKPFLKKKFIVICDRFVDSTTAYQTGGRRLPVFFVQYMNRMSSQGLMPDLTILLDVDPKKGIARGTKNEKKDKFESETMAFHRSVRRAYLEIANKEPKRVQVFSTSGNADSVQESIRRTVDEKLGNQK